MSQKFLLKSLAKRMGWLFILIMVAAAIVGFAQTKNLSSEGSPSLDYVPDEIIVKFKNLPDNYEPQYKDGIYKMNKSALDKLHKKFKVREARHIFKNVKKSTKKSFSKILGKEVEVPDLYGTMILKISSGSVLEAIEEYKKDPNVEYAEPNYIKKPLFDPNDTHYLNGKQWHLKNTGQSGPTWDGGWIDNTAGKVDADIDADKAWDLIQISTIVVAVLDTGFQFNHEDLFSPYWTNSGDMTINGIDDDGNGYIDDWRGWDFANNDNDPTDNQGHGTHVAGIIGAALNNSKGVAGVINGLNNIMNVKILGGTYGGTITTEVNGIQYAVDNGARVLNMSFGSYGYSTTEHDAIKYAASKGAILVGAAGNDDYTYMLMYPASYPEVISVASLTRQNKKSSFSNKNTEVDLSAPGELYSSTYSASGLTNYYGWKGGTSMASPVVAGVAALVWGKYPTLSAQQIRACLEAGVDDVYADNPLYSGLLGKGRVNAYKALIAASCLPEPTNVSGTAISTSAISWSWDVSNYNRSGFYIMSSTYGAISPILSKYQTSWTGNYTSGPNTPQQIYVVSFSTGVSDYSEVVAYATASVISPSVYTLANPPSNPYFYSVSKYLIDVDWESNGNPYYSRWLVERSTDGANYQTLKNWDSNYTSTSYLDSDIKLNTTYYYRIAAYNGNQIKTSYSTVISTIIISPLAPPPSNPRFVSSSKMYSFLNLYELKILWDANGNSSYTRWRIDRSTVSPTQNFTTIVGWSDIQTETSYTDKNLVPNVTYFYKIASLNDDQLENFCSIVISTCIVENKINPSNPYTEPALTKGDVGIQYLSQGGVNDGYMRPLEKVNIYFVPVTDGVVTMKVVTLGGRDIYSVDKWVMAGSKYYFDFQVSEDMPSGIYPVIIEGAGIRKIKKICVIK